MVFNLRASPRQGVPDKVSPTLVSDASIGETCLTAVRLA